MRAHITLGPLLFHWQPDRWRDFYARIADEAPVDSVCLGEVVCSKRTPFTDDLLAGAAERLERAGKSVILSTLAMPTLTRERRHAGKLIAGTTRLIEANDASTLHQLAGRPHVVGPMINVYNEATFAYLARNGATRVCVPPELPLTSIRTLAASAPGTAIEVFAFGRAPLAISARCYHARVHGLTKDTCRFVCGEDPDGLDVDTLDGGAFLSVNGVQTMSRTYTCLIEDIPALIAAGVSALRLSPHTCDMAAVARIFREVAEGRSEPAAAAEQLRLELPGIALSNGFLHGVEGARFVTAH